MYDKRFIKIKKVGDERYFRDNREFIKFIEKQGGRTWEEMCDIYIAGLSYSTKGPQSGTGTSK
ncbi:MAG: hypothetical protein LUD76_10035 [Alistipes sp.]|nr:hypothetical protein [Alistipes sp.]